jgi:hypothetical protein
MVICHGNPGFHFTCNIRNVSKGRDTICRRRRVLPWQTLNANLHCTSVTLYHIRAKLLLKPITIQFFFRFVCSICYEKLHRDQNSGIRLHCKS